MLLPRLWGAGRSHNRLSIPRPVDLLADALLSICVVGCSSWWGLTEDSSIVGFWDCPIHLRRYCSPCWFSAAALGHYSSWRALPPWRQHLLGSLGCCCCRRRHRQIPLQIRSVQGVAPPVQGGIYISHFSFLPFCLIQELIYNDDGIRKNGLI